MSIRLRDGLYYARVNTQIMMLDVRADRYFCLPSLADAAFQKLVESEGRDFDPDALSPLLKRGLLEFDRPWQGRAPVIRPVSASAMARYDERVRLSYLFSAYVENTLAIDRLKRATLATILSKVEQRKSTAGGAAPSAAPDMVASFLAVRRMLGAHDKCLRWSLAMINYLAAKGHFPSLVFGVRLRPFAAHAWVQSEDTVLNDHLEHVKLYTPILAI